MMLRVFLALVLLVVGAQANNLKDAVEALEQEDFARATELLGKALAEDPENVEARFNLAYAYSRLNQNEPAIEQYRKVVKQKPDLVAAHMNLGILLMSAERAEEAAPHFEVAAETRPDDFHAWHYYAHALLSSGNAEAAVEPYQKAVALNSNSADAALGLGRALARAGRLEEAVPHYRRAASLDPELSQMTLELAELLEKKKHPEQALVLYQEYLKSDPAAIAVRERVGILLMELERYSEAVPIFEAAVKENATVANRAALAEAYSLNDQPEKALPQWREAVGAEPSNPDLRLRYANALLHAELFDDAARNYLAALESNTSLVDAWNGLAFSLYKAENLPGALKALRRSAEVSEPKPAQLYLRAIIEDKLQMHEEALASYREFLAADSELAEEQWKSKQRIKALEKVLEKN